MDCINEKCERMEIDLETCSNVNSMHPLERGCYLYKLYNTII